MEQESTSPTERLLTCGAVAKCLGITAPRVRQLMKYGYIRPAVQSGQYVRFAEPDVWEWIRKRIK